MQDEEKQIERIMDAWREMRRGRSMQAYRELQFAGLGVTELGESDAVQLLDAHREMRIGELARALRVERYTATRTVDRLEKAGLAERQTHYTATGGRSKTVVCLTASGREHARITTERRTALMKQVFVDMTSAERDVVADSLESIVAGVKRVVREHGLAAD